ncbi:hypothetical protein BWQ96_10511 [Gracilariopsis chorda]|uniref:Uncharacterized protein n=1 Tax=Gracilariopsis chorda TaxID=448386 RepID=A0A2V3ICH1_9FLOR|nr:hypothetical protein BWQ96_10511 [Gracilariopsis chorda]|eukprot:PXF39783.1 hypothetical protein BWQ96_10511 [Gracilariopsis chorda]
MQFVLPDASYIVLVGKLVIGVIMQIHAVVCMNIPFRVFELFNSFIGQF